MGGWAEVKKTKRSKKLERKRRQIFVLVSEKRRISVSH